MGPKPLMSAAAAVADITSGSILLFGGFGTCGFPHAVAAALSQRSGEVKHLELFSNAAALPGWGLGLIFERGMVKRVSSSYVGSNPIAAKAYLKGEMEIEFTPQGSLAERMRAGGAGIPAGAKSDAGARSSRRGLIIATD